jgi:hypothetical protein
MTSRTEKATRNEATIALGILVANGKEERTPDLASPVMQCIYTLYSIHN